MCEPTAAALVIGSAQRAPANATGYEVVRRRTGGGAVLVEPGGLCWLDVSISRADPLWDDELHRSFAWVGRAWRDALSALGIADASIHEGPPIRTAWSREICFAGTGPGEVAVAGRKAVGVAQRRTREGAWFQCAALLRWDADATASALGLPAAAEVAAAVRDRARAIPLDAVSLRDGFVAALPVTG